jgi:hypothetical protein
MIFIIYRSLNYFLNFLKGRNWAHMQLNKFRLNWFKFILEYKISDCLLFRKELQFLITFNQVYIIKLKKRNTTLFNKKLR